MELPFTNCSQCGQKYTRAFEPVRHSCGVVTCTNCAHSPPRDSTSELDKYSVHMFNFHLQNYRSHNLSIAEEKEQLMEEMEEQCNRLYVEAFKKVRQLESTSSIESDPIGRVFSTFVDLLRLQAEYLRDCTQPLPQVCSAVSVATTDLLNILHESSTKMQEARKLYKKIAELQSGPGTIAPSELCTSRMPSSVQCRCEETVEQASEAEDVEDFFFTTTPAAIFSSVEKPPDSEIQIFDAWIDDEPVERPSKGKIVVISSSGRNASVQKRKAPNEPDEKEIPDVFQDSSNSGGLPEDFVELPKSERTLGKHRDGVKQILIVDRRAEVPNKRRSDHIRKNPNHKVHDDVQKANFDNIENIQNPEVRTDEETISDTHPQSPKKLPLLEIHFTPEKRAEILHGARKHEDKKVYCQYEVYKLQGDHLGSEFLLGESKESCQCYSEKPFLVDHL